MNIKNREWHHIIMGNQRFRCEQCDGDDTTLLIGGHAIFASNVYAVPCTSEREMFMGYINSYMNSIEDGVIAQGKRCVLADTHPRDNGSIFYGEVILGPNGERTYTASFADSINDLMERL